MHAKLSLQRITVATVLTISLHVVASRDVVIYLSKGSSHHVTSETGVEMETGS